MNKLFSIKDEYKHILITIFGIKIRFSRNGYRRYKIPTHLNNIPILKLSDANNCIINELSKNKPCFITRIGIVEILAIDCYINYKDKNGNCKFPETIKENMQNQTGFFNVTDEYLTRYAKETLEMFKNIDILAACNYRARNNPSEEKLLKNYGNENTKLIEFNTLNIDTFFFDDPWTKLLENKKVLVIHPFEDSIIKQYQKRELLFKNSKLLPKFELKTIKAIQGIDTKKAKEKYDNWFNALEIMYKQIDETDFDIALIGAGSFGMFLGNYIKSKGKQAIHLGGSLQIHFGIKGARWEDTVIKNLYNEHWIRPQTSEQVSDLDKFIKEEKNAAYW